MEDTNDILMEILRELQSQTKILSGINNRLDSIESDISNIESNSSSSESELIKIRKSLDK